MFWIEISSNIFADPLDSWTSPINICFFVLAHFLDVFFGHIAEDSVYGSIG